MQMLRRSISSRSRRSTEPGTALSAVETRSTAPTEFLPQALPYDVLRHIFSLAVLSTSEPKERQHLCLTIAALSSDWTEVGLRFLYASRLTFKSKRFRPSSRTKKKQFACFYSAVLGAERLASAVTWLKVDVGLVKGRLTELLTACKAIKVLGLKGGELPICHLHAATTVTCLSLEVVTLVAEPPVFQSSLTFPYTLNKYPLYLPDLTSLTLSNVWFNSAVVGKVLSPLSLPSLTHLTTDQVFAWNEVTLRDAFFSLCPKLTHLTSLDPLRWTRHALLRCGETLTHLRIAETPKNATSLRHILPFLNASPHPLKTLHIYAGRISQRSSQLDAAAVLARGLILAVCERRTSVIELGTLTLAGPGWVVSEMIETLGLLGSVCALKSVEFKVKLEQQDLRAEWLDKALEVGGEWE
ncbi:hypothetical protein JCM10213_005445 [Rhodosporidiobolus nylandii]